MRKIIQIAGISVLAIGLAYKSLFGADIDSDLNQNTTIAKLKSKIWPIEGYFIHYDRGPYDWAYIVAKSKNLYRLEGMDPRTGYLLWTRLPYREVGLEIVKYEDLIYIGEKVEVGANLR